MKQEISSPSVSVELQPDSVTEGDYLAPPADYSIQEPQQARRRIVLALVCVLTLPLCACSITPLLDGPYRMVRIIIFYGVLGATFGFPFFILGRHQKGTIKLSMVWVALGLLGISIALI